MCSGSPKSAKTPSSAETPASAAAPMVSPEAAKRNSTDPEDLLMAQRKKGINSLRIDLSAPATGTGLAIPL